MIWCEGAAKWCVGGGLVCLASSCGSSGRPAGGWKAHCALQMVHASGLEEGEGDGDGQAHKDCLHPPPSPIDPHGSTATEESPGCGAGGREGGREVGKSSMYSWVTSSTSEPQGEAKMTFNGNYPVTSAWVMSISVFLNLWASFPPPAADCLMVGFSLLLRGLQLQSEACMVLLLVILRKPARNESLFKGTYAIYTLVTWGSRD